ncbi:hypothetical protein CYLTODRAFT_495409 [Cylindrobasidium torrendii FP15055 ss-10]|uniref:Uncharacterized protein n=1 Tax=Cylindrobasidium torrendii FP15055 ss-10 TaxID=1314674 RepID=A0A0D7ASU1_9AGAR|nr:hypothetical protein CYLTODRAFT_495409 [Cylindrobasidium torrendii FP15055 ss-10]
MSYDHMPKSMSPITSQGNDSHLFASMPRDVLLTIFGYEIHESKTLINALSNRSPLWCFGQVCVHWRQILRSYPLFWNHLDVNFSHFPSAQPLALENRFRQLVHLSGRATVLHIGMWMAASITCDLGDRIAGVIGEVAGRIGELEIVFGHLPRIDRATLPLPLLQSKLLKNCVFSALHTLLIAIPFSQVRLGDVSQIRVDAFAQCPLLRRLSLREETHRVKFVLPYQNLTTIYANGGRLDYIINQLENTTDIDLDLCPISLTHEQPPPIPLHLPPTWQATTLNTLKSLRIRCSSFDFYTAIRDSIFRSLHASALRKLELHGSCSELVPILAMVPGSALCGLHELIVNSVRETPEYLADVQSFMHLMARMPALRSLSISDTFGHYVLCALVEGDGIILALAVLKISAELLLQDIEKVVCFARCRRGTLSVEVIVSTSYTYHGQVERFLSDILGSYAATSWTELRTLVPVSVI